MECDIHALNRKFSIRRFVTEKKGRETLNYTCVIVNIKRSGSTKAKEKSLMERFRHRHNDHGCC